MPTSTQISRWGNSLALRIPKSILDAASFKEGDSVKITVEHGGIVVRPARPKYTLDELVGKITPRNRHTETNWGKAEGHEEW